LTDPGPGRLYVVATPIGNLEDITLRALRVLRECDAVVAEDTRRTRQLLAAHGISRPLLSLPAHDERRRVPALVHRLANGETLALCTDAGTPVMSDPGAPLVAAARAADVEVVPIPGASALTTAVAGSGLRGDRVCFLGFLPRSPGKLRRAVEAGLMLEGTVAFYESPLRLARTLALIAPSCGERPVVVARELTKVHETFHTGTAAALAEAFAAHPPRGECTVLIGAS
jgi:16S rRNA (cytidine1402-2'-O)-methyltransferase